MMKNIQIRQSINFLLLTFICLLGTNTSFAQQQVLSTTYYHTDAAGSPVVATDENGDVKWREQYRPYGDKMVDDLAAEDNTRGFTGHKFDRETGLTYMGARYYDPIVGRFMAIDPIGYKESNIHSFNRYAYANNNPYGYVDPDGRAAKLIKAAYNVVKKAQKNGWDFKKAGKEEIVNFVDNVTTLADGQFTADDVFAVIDIVTGFGSEVKSVTKGGGSGKTYQTYTKTNPKTGEVYTGRTSGTGTPQQNIDRRDAGHHMNKKGFGPAVPDKSSSSYGAIRGREQQLIQANGGAKSMGGTSGNAINGVSPKNPKGPGYRYDSYKAFGK